MKERNNRIAMLYCYFGKWPTYFNLFIKSCSKNPEIDFIFFSDSEFSVGEIYENIKYFNITLKQFNALASQRLNLNINVQNPYKLCDFKPAYGHILQEHVKDYDFWGFGDIDIILGDIRHFITDDVLEQYDIVSVRKEYISGFYCLFRNDEKINLLFSKSRDYKTVLQSQRNFCFDECNYAFDRLMLGESITNIETEIQSMTDVVAREQQNNNLKVHYETIVDEEVGVYFWEDGKIYNLEKNNEIMLLHLISHKENSFFEFPKWKEVPDTFYINYFGFHKKQMGWNFYLKDAILKMRFVVSVLSTSARIAFGTYFLTTNKLNRDALLKYVGYFQLGPSYVTIELDSGMLALNGYGKRIKFKPLNKFLFLAEESQIPFLLKFALNNQGRAVGLTIHSTPTPQIWQFTKIG